MEANFIISGTGEWIGCLIGAVLMKELSRRSCIFIFLIATASSFAFQEITDLKLFPSINSQIVNTINNGIGTVSALSTIFVVLIVNQEVFPTVIRQTGSSVVNTIGESGSTLAPLLTQLCLLIGSANVNLISAVLCLLGAFCAYFLTETASMELNDAVNGSTDEDEDEDVNTYFNSGRHSSVVELQISMGKKRNRAGKSMLFSKFNCFGAGLESRKSSGDRDMDEQAIDESLPRADIKILDQECKHRFYGATK